MTVVTLGRFGITGLGAAEANRLLKQPKRAAVLLYVLLSQRGGALLRDQIVATFWPESDAPRARNALRQALSFLRSCLGDGAVLSIGTNGLAIDDEVACDAAQFEALLDAGRREDALAMYGGELLPGFYAGSTVFDEWLDARRTHLGRRAAKAAWDLSSDAETAGDLSAAAFWGKRALALSPFSESEVQRLLRLLVRVKDYAGALRAYHGLQQQLATEFGSRPSAETSRMATEIRQRVESEGMNVPSLLGTRRSGADRRMGCRRKKNVAREGPERRRTKDRRTKTRRSGTDRRAIH